jgi:methionyl-tRNA formyltransferase
MGTPELAAVCLRALQSCADFEIVAVVTQPDRPKGRDLRVTASPVKILALESKIPVLQPEKAGDENFVEQLRAFQPQIIVVAAYGQILPQAILDAPPFGCVNVHTSLLPKYRGAAPIQRVLMNGDSETGITLIKMDAQMDTGPIIAQVSLPILPEDNATTLHDRLAQLGGSVLLRYLPDYLKGDLPLHPQNSQLATYAPKVKKEEGLIHWPKPAVEILNQFRGLFPWPGLFTYLPPPAVANPSRKILKIWRVAVTEGQGLPGTILRIEDQGPVVMCGSGSLRMEELQLEGGKRLAAREFLKGHIFKPGQRLG